jgi:hypothetical protein
MNEIVENTNKDSTFGSEMVSLDRFGKILSWFGPFKSDGMDIDGNNNQFASITFLDRVRSY